MSVAVAGLDAGFLLTETPTMHWHVLGVLIVDPSTAPEPFGVASVRRLLEARLPEIEAFHKAGVRRPAGAVAALVGWGDRPRPASPPRRHLSARDDR